MRRFKSFSSLLTFMALLGTAQAGDLLTHYRNAVGYDAQFLAASALSKVGEEELAIGLAGLLPSLSLDAQSNWSQARYEGDGVNLEYRRQSRRYGVELRQPVFRWQNWVRYRKGEQQKALSRLQFGIAAQELMLRVAKSYFDVLVAYEVLDVLGQLLEVDAEQLAGSRRRFELGDVSIADVYEAQASFDLVSARLIAARSKLGLARQELQLITGLVASEVKVVAGRVDMVLPLPADVHVWAVSATRNSLEVQAQEVLLEIAKYEVQSSKSEHLPSLDLVATTSTQQNPQPGAARGVSAAIGLRISMPLYAGGGTNAGVRKAEAQAAKAEYDLAGASRAAALRTREAWAGIAEGIEQVRALEAAKISAKSALAANQLGFKIGERTGKDVLEMQSQYSDTLQRLSSARYDTLMAKLRLKAAVGTLSETDLAEVSRLLGEQA